MEQFNKINDDLEKLERAQVEDVKKKQSLDQAVKMTELETEIEVSVETDKDGKKKFTNEKARKAEAHVRLNQKDQYNCDLKALELLSYALAIGDISVRKLSRTFSAMKSINYGEARKL